MINIELIEQVNANQDISATDEQIHDLMQVAVNIIMEEGFKGTYSSVLYDTFLFAYKHVVNDKTRVTLFVSKGYKSFEYEIP